MSESYYDNATLDEDGNVDVQGRADLEKYRIRPRARDHGAVRTLTGTSGDAGRGRQNALGNVGGYNKSKFDQRFLKEALVMARGGLTEHEISDAFDISNGTLQLWKKEYPELAIALLEGRSIWDDRVEASLAQAAIGYSHPAVQILMTKEGDVVQVDYVKHYPPNVQAANLWLANRKQKEWGASIGENTPQHLLLTAKLDEMASKIEAIAAMDPKDSAKAEAGEVKPSGD